MWVFAPRETEVSSGMGGGWGEGNIWMYIGYTCISLQ